MEDARVVKLAELLKNEDFVRGLAKQIQPEDAQAYFAAHGLDFTKDEILQMGRALNLKVRQERGEELTEDELAEVSGGYGALGTFFLLDGFKALPVVLSKFLSFWFNW